MLLYVLGGSLEHVTAVTKQTQRLDEKFESVQRLTCSVRKDRLRVYVDHARSLVRDAPTIGR
jgi:hypothetical protein